MDQGFYDVLVTLAKIGAAGVGIAIFLMVFLMIIRGTPVDPETAKLRKSFLIWGFAFAVVVGLFTVVPPLLQKGAAPVPVLLTYSPDMEADDLPLPRAILPNGKIVDAGQPFSLQPSLEPQQLVIRVDKTIAQVRSLKDASKELAASVAQIKEQRDALATSGVAAPAAEQHLEAQAQQTEQLRTQVTESIQSGDYARASTLSRRLRSSVINTQPTITAIARGLPQQ